MRNDTQNMICLACGVIIVTSLVMMLCLQSISSSLSEISQNLPVSIQVNNIGNGTEILGLSVEESPPDEEK